MEFITIISIIILGIIIYQDFRYRAVSWVLFPLLFVLSFLFTFLEENIMTSFVYSISNIFFLSTQMIIVYLYIIITMKGSRRFTEIIGWGDILFLVAVAPYFSFPLYVLYVVTGMLLTLLAYFFIIRLRRLSISNYPIPLAGVLAAYLFAINVSQWLLPNLKDGLVNSWNSFMFN